MPDLGIVIVNWNTRDLLKACLVSLEASDPSVSIKTVVVDNASTDSSIAMVRSEFPKVHVIAQSENSGFAAANNLGLRNLGFADPGMEPPRYGLLLNPDTVVPDQGLRVLIDLMDERTSVGMVGPKLVMLDGKLDLACRRSFPTPEISLWRMTGLSKLFPKSRLFGRYNMTYLPEDQEVEVDSVVGAFMLVRAEAIAAVGLLDETFWMYGEDLDWAFRIKKAGWSVLYAPRVSVLHVKRAASRKNPRAQVEFNRAMLLFYRKHYRSTTPFWMHALVLLGLTLRGGRAMLHTIRTDPTWTIPPNAAA